MLIYFVITRCLLRVSAKVCYLAGFDVLATHMPNWLCQVGSQIHSFSQILAASLLTNRGWETEQTVCTSQQFQLTPPVHPNRTSIRMKANVSTWLYPKNGNQESPRYQVILKKPSLSLYHKIMMWASPILTTLYSLAWEDINWLIKFSLVV